MFIISSGTKSRQRAPLPGRDRVQARPVPQPTMRQLIVTFTALGVFVTGAFLVGFGLARSSEPWQLPDFSLPERKVDVRAELVMLPSPPQRIRIPHIKVDAPIDALGLDDGGEVAVPSIDEGERTSWYKLGPSPGESGQAVILGHVDTRSQPAVFHNLHKLRYRHKIEVDRADGSTAVFQVESGGIYNKKKFPAKKVFAGPHEPRLAIVTCGGAWDAKRDSYSHNIVVFAVLVEVKKP